MTTANGPILLFEINSPARDQIVSYFENEGLQAISVDQIEENAANVAALNPSLFLFDSRMTNAKAQMDLIRSLFPEVPLVALASSDHMSEVFVNFRHQADDFIFEPIDALTLAMLRHRLMKKGQRAADRHRCGPNALSGSPKPTIDKIATERLVAVRQIVEKMSLLVAKLAKDVQGGMQFFNEMPYFLAIHNRQGIIMATNPIYSELLGHKIGKPGWEIFRGKRANRKQSPVGRTIETGMVLTTKAVVQYKSGARVPVIVHTAPIYNDDGEVELILEVFAGTREVERLAAEIKTTQQRYQQLFDAVPSFIAVLDRRYRVTAANQRFRSVFGNPIGKRFFDVFIPSKMAKKSSPIRKTLNDGQPHQAEMVLIAQDGKQYDVLAWTSPIFTPAGKLVQILVIFLDITELRDLQDNLSSLGMMMGTVSHSLKGSLTGLGAALYLIDTGFYRNQPAKIEEGLDIAQLVVERIRKLVVDILYYAKDRELELENVDVVEFCSEVIQQVDQRIRGANIRFDIDYQNAYGTFEVDAGLLRSALINLLENAIEACIEDPSDHRHTIRFKVNSERNFVQFFIEDDGVGMEPDQIEHAFAPFYSTKGKSGTGLGLFITKKVLQKHGGGLTVDSDPGGGTRFQIRLPRTIAGVAR